MKTGIITFHFPYNCGAVLQCAALQTVVHQHGHEAVVINYRPWYHQNRYTCLKNPFQFAKTRYMELGDSVSSPIRLAKSCMGFVRGVGSWRHYAERKPRDDKFRLFREAHLNETPVYRTLGQLQKNPPDCDLYISGSDQLWNCHLTEKRFDRAYFLHFGGEDVVRISYAVGADFTECEDSSISLGELLMPLDAISLRENKCRAIIEENTFSVPIARCIDPTLLLCSGDYDSMTCKKELESEPFILTYTMPNPSQEQVYDAAEELGRRTGMKVIDISGNPSKANRRIADNRTCSPDEFLWYVKNASYVLSNSFHGTVFSALFEKQFVTIPHTDTGNRVTELLDSLGLASRWTDNPSEAADIVCRPVDYNEFHKRLAVLRQESLDFLRRAFAAAEA